MAKTKTVYTCTNCAYESSRWLGKCPGCNEWNTMEETTVEPETNKTAGIPHEAKVMCLSDIHLNDSVHIPVGLEELDRVLGGGLIEGAVVLVGGEPGVGKSTLLLQAAQRVADGGRNTLYVSAEESARQIRMRAQRLGVESGNLFILARTDIDEVCQAIESMNAPFVVIDSIQAMQKQDIRTSMGSVAQIRECAQAAVRCAKQTGATIVLIGHVTKEGNIAGPRVLEHMVDTVLYFEGERQQSFRILRAVKNRFGSTNEIGVFEMTELGMREVKNPSEFLISRHTKDVPGAAVTCTMQGARPVLCEVQALCAASPYGQPRRMATGIDYNRLLLIIAVLERSCGIALFNRDVYANAVGGLRLSEPACDAALIAALASAATGHPLYADVAVIGEIGLTGEVRPVSQILRRASECAKMGFTKIVAPKDSAKGVKTPNGMVILPADNVAQVLSFALNHRESAEKDSGYQPDSV